MLHAGSTQLVAPMGSARSCTVPLGVPVEGTALTNVPVPLTEIVSWLLEHVVPSESTVITPWTTGDVVPTVSCDPPLTLRAVHPVGSSSQSAGVIVDFVMLGRTVAERVEPRDPFPSTPPKIRPSDVLITTRSR